MTTRSKVAGRVGLHRNQWHQYAWGASGWQPGVTTILRVQDALSGSDGLIRWATKLAAEAAFGVARASDSALFSDAVEAAITAVDSAKSRGTDVHAGIEAMIAGYDFAPSPETMPYWFGWSRFLVKEKPEILFSEQTVINLTAGYGGTFDLDATVRGQRALIDVKTGAPKPAHALQLAAYAGAEWMGSVDDPNKYDLPDFEAFYVLALMPEAPYYELVPLTVGKAEIDHFLFLAKTYHQLKAWNKEQAA